MDKLKQILNKLILTKKDREFLYETIANAGKNDDKHKDAFIDITDIWNNEDITILSDENYKKLLVCAGIIHLYRKRYAYYNRFPNKLTPDEIVDIACTIDNTVDESDIVCSFIDGCNIYRDSITAFVLTNNKHLIFIDV